MGIDSAAEIPKSSLWPPSERVRRWEFWKGACADRRIEGEFRETITISKICVVHFKGPPYNRVQSGLHPYVCNEINCGKPFKTKSNLKVRLQRESFRFIRQCRMLCNEINFDRNRKIYDLRRSNSGYHTECRTFVCDKVFNHSDASKVSHRCESPTASWIDHAGTYV